MGSEKPREVNIKGYNILFIIFFSLSIKLFADEILYISEIPIVDRKVKNSANIIVYSNNIDKLYKSLPKGFSPVIINNSIYLQLKKEYVPLGGKIATEFKSQSFMVDFDVPFFQLVEDDIKKQYGPSPTEQQLEDFIFKYITKKSHGKGFDIASQVVKTKEGDCTEHAVLLTAISRMFKIPARVVVGNVIVHGNPPKAFGHAWVEYYENSTWKKADATKININNEITYIPVSYIKDESVTYNMDLVRIIMMGIVKIEL